MSYRIANGIHRALLILGVAAAAAPTAAQTSGPYHDLQEATKLIELQEYATAEEILVTLSEMIPESGSMWYALAVSRHKQDKAEKALADAHQAIKRNDKHADAHLLIAEIEAAAKHSDRVTRHALRAAEVDGKRLEIARGAIELLVAARAYEPALRVLQKANTQHPKNADLLRLQAKIAVGLKRLGPAAAAYRGLLTIEPRDPGVLESLANVYRLNGDKKPAIETYEKLLKINPSNNNARQRLIELMSKSKYSAKQLRVQRLYLRYYARAKPSKKPTQPATPPKPPTDGDDDR